MMITRFAPSPSGLLHLGHAYSAWTGWAAARRAGGTFLLRIEDIDTARCRADFETAIFEDLAWLGLDWAPEVMRQSARTNAYAAALDRLDTLGVLFPCFCSRREIRAEVAAMTRAPHGPDGPLYPGTCKALSAAERAERIAAGMPYSLRLDAADAAARTGPLSWHEVGEGRIAVDPGVNGDVVMARKEVATSYHLSVVVDDADQAITLVTRGRDLIHATHVHRLLQALLDLPAPDYAHHRLLTDADGERLAKRADAFALRGYRAQGLAPAEVWALAGVGWEAAPGRPAV
ncbi:MAG: tRNA glutamyl-Q(34) synthetase GluQRS [Deinococcus-Thermus bacterium]|nr:tRNA glutamyl-Q(34) synthetase GluQRS [Deinococcota bacterium]